MEQISRVNHIGIRVSDFEQSRDFYKKLGFQTITGPSGPEPVAIVEHPSGININFILNADKGDKKNQLMDIPTKYTGYTHVALEVSSAKAVITTLAELDIPLSGEPMTHPTGTSFFIRDPDDNVIEFIEYSGLTNLAV
ncbi:VOC family protein [Vibrio methylphosphonaticus]|uniref:VOC family protein n=1 Tax=Vibrio methylphosphonaticus TaxID=2946866 RepID=UPI002029C582|nr:VOC family protein [Vibrio methylphosphonaticus]MCL9776821.1 VOC family protein [Vibrio methylphosphonaticus]